ncbi:uncharacterized protein LOC119080271 isoform X2 [Bradysia coprophila]|nr:uncharacterized protein LOC119080271 isoform X2 [Bradysia coprophila]
MGTSDYYLERVGLEGNLRLRLNLKKGINAIGRAGSRSAIDFGIDSSRCSALHCEITVSGNSVEIVNKSKTVGTTVNEIKLTEHSLQLKENDIIGIVRGIEIPWDLTGNYNLFVYRLCRYTSENLLTIEIDDDETYEISDDENPYDDDVIIVDPIDIKVEHDLNIQLSRDLNAEIKKELEDIDESETYFTQIKQEPSNFFEIETTGDIVKHEPADITTFDPHQPNEDYNPEMLRRESNDSTDTLIFSPSHEQDDEHGVEYNSEGAPVNIRLHSDDETIENVRLFVEQEFEVDTAEIDRSRKKDVPEMVVDIKQMDKRHKRSGSNDSTETSIFSPTHQRQDERSNQCNSKDTPVNKQTLSNGETVENVKLVVERNSDRVAAEAVENVKRKDGPELVEPKPMGKRQKKNVNANENKSDRSQTEKTTATVKRKEKPKIASTSTPAKSNEKSTAKTLAKVKYTKDNRGAFLTDPTQMPGLPTPVKERRKSIFATVPPLRPSVPPVPINGSNTNDAEVDEVVSKLIDDVSKLIDDDAKYSSYKIKKLSFNDLRKADVYDASCNSPVHQNGGSTPNSGYSEKVSRPKTGNVSINESFPNQTGFDTDICSVPDGRTGQNELKHKQTPQPHNERAYQINPCHEVISILTSYDYEQFKTVDTFCQSIDTNVQSFGDKFDDFTEYQGKILPLMMLELYKEIELEYQNSMSQDFLNVVVMDKNLERRGEGRRMVFHCQVEISCRSKYLFEGHLVLARCDWNRKKIEFLAMISSISYVGKTENLRLAYFTLETSVLNESMPVESLQIRAITVISNTLNGFRSIYSLHSSPLLNLILNPLSTQLSPKLNAKVAYKGYTNSLDTDQMSALKEIYNRCKNLNVPNISLVDGASGTGKSFLISDLALQLVYGDSLPKPLRILICSRSNRNIDEITRKLLYVRDRTVAAQKIQLVRFGLLEQIDLECRCVSVQYMKENEQRFIQLANIEKLEKEKKTLELKVRALHLDDENDNKMELKLWKNKLIKVNTLLGRLRAIDKTKLGDATTILLNACDIICTTLGSITKLQSFIPHVDVCIIDESSRCNEALTLLPLRFGMSSLVLFGDSSLAPPVVCSQVANELNYGNSLFRRIYKLYSSTPDSPIFRLNIQHRMHPEIGMWPNAYFYNNVLHQAPSNLLDNLPIVPYKLISYAPGMESDNIMFVVNYLCNNIDPNKYTIGVICTNSKDSTVMRNKLSDHPQVGVYPVYESHLVERDVVIIWISKEHGMSHLADSTLFNRAVTRAKRSLLICGADLALYKSRPMWKSILEDAQERKRYVHLKKFLQSKLNTLLRRKV